MYNFFFSDKEFSFVPCWNVYGGLVTHTTRTLFLSIKINWGSLPVLVFVVVVFVRVVNVLV